MKNQSDVYFNFTKVCFYLVVFIFIIFQRISWLFKIKEQEISGSNKKLQEEKRVRTKNC